MTQTVEFGNKIAESIRQRAKNAGIDPFEASRRFAMERLIVRLAAADDEQRLMLKGGMLWWLQADLQPFARPTIDMDIHLHIPESHEDVIQLFEVAKSIEVDDGCRFEFTKMRKLEHTGEHEGLRVNIRGFIGDKFFDFHTDIGFGGRRPDYVVPTEFGSQHPKLPGSQILMAPLEYVVAEKLSAIVKIGMENTRMKDYNDILVLSTMNLDDDKLSDALRFTFEDRNQDIPTDVEDVEGLSNAYVSNHQEDWERWFKQAKRTGKVPEDFGTVVATVKSFASDIFSAAYSNKYGR